MKKSIGIIVWLCAVLAAPLGTAAPITMQFTASGFGAGAPVAAVSGVIKWDAASLHAPVTTLTSIDLTIAGHQYLVSEIEFLTDATDSNHVGIGNKDANTLPGGIDDFVITYFLDFLSADLFGYTVQGSTDQFFATSLSLQVTADDAVAVPEPATGALLGLVLGGLAVMRWRRESCS